MCIGLSLLRCFTRYDVLCVFLIVISRYAIASSDKDWEGAESQIAVQASGKKGSVSTVVSVRNPESTKKRKPTETAADLAAREAKRKVGGAGGKVKMSKKTRRT